MKRSRRVVLTLMGSAAVGAVSMGLVPRRDCGPGKWPVLGSGRASPIAARPMAASAARRIDSMAMAMAMVMAATRMAAVRLIPHATHRLSRTRRLARDRREAPALTFTPSMASATGTSAPITRSRSMRSSATSRRRPARSTRCASNWSAARSATNEYLRRLRIPEAFWPLIFAESWHRGDFEPLRPARPEF